MMKAIKDIFCGKGLPRKCEKGFTLVELLIVLAILAVLAAVVIPNVTGMFGRGAAQAWDTDSETIQMACATFFFDVHDMDGTSPGHWYPTDDGGAGTGADPAGGTVTDADLTDGALGNYKIIYMGLLSNTPVDPISWVVNGNVADGEKGPYLNEPPESCADENYTGATGSYIWTIGADGKVYGFWLTTTANTYQEGFGDAYP